MFKDPIIRGRRNLEQIFKYFDLNGTSKKTTGILYIYVMRLCNMQCAGENESEGLEAQYGWGAGPSLDQLSTEPRQCGSLMPKILRNIFSQRKYTFCLRLDIIIHSETCCNVKNHKSQTIVCVIYWALLRLDPMHTIRYCNFIYIYREFVWLHIKRINIRLHIWFIIVFTFPNLHNNNVYLAARYNRLEYYKKSGEKTPR